MVAAFAAAQTTQSLPEITVTARAAGRTWPDSLRRVVRDSLAVGKARWLRMRPEHYDLSVSNIPAWVLTINSAAHEGHRRVMQIRYDSIVAIVLEPASQFTKQSQWRDITVDGIFRDLDRQVGDSLRQFRLLELDPAFGYPRAWRTDHASNGYGAYRSDQAGGGDVLLFRVTAPTIDCRWWRRMIRRCG